LLCNRRNSSTFLMQLWQTFLSVDLVTCARASFSLNPVRIIMLTAGMAYLFPV
jgi:hypothetical protein